MVEVKESSFGEGMSQTTKAESRRIQVAKKNPLSNGRQGIFHVRILICPQQSPVTLRDQIMTLFYCFATKGGPKVKRIYRHLPDLQGVK